MEDYIYGRNNVIELLIEGKRRVSKIILMKGIRADNRINRIIEMSKEKGIVYQYVAKERFIQYGEISHQGVVAYVSPIEYTDINEFIKKGTSRYKRVIITDGVEDPNNLGSIIRSGVCAGYDGVIIPKRRNASINSAVEKASAGAINHIDIIQVNSLTVAIDKLKDNDFWIIATDIKAIDNYYEIDYCDMNFAIVLGSEKEGISKTIIKQADYRVKIPILNKFNSLNVANAASIVMYESVRQILQKSGE